MSFPSKSSGFTLTEMSIVIAIVGLILGGLLLGRNLIHQAKLRSLIKQYEEYNAAISTFKAQYAGLPGDIIDATSYWAGASNGNGNGFWFNLENEEARVWQHLALSELITGSFNGVDELPEARLEKNFWLPQTHSNAIYSVPANSRNSLNLNSSATSWQPSISPIDASIIDRKIDDGNATAGAVMGFSVNWAITNCVKDTNGTGNNVGHTYTGTDANYDTQSNAMEEKVCQMAFLL